MGSIGWREATPKSLCPVCGKPDWCSVSSDGHLAICRRGNNGVGIHKVDKSGQDYWLYKLNGHVGSSSPEGGSTQDYDEAPEKAGPEKLDKVYGALLDELSLSNPHRQDLHRR